MIYTTPRMAIICDYKDKVINLLSTLLMGGNWHLLQSKCPSNCYGLASYLQKVKGVIFASCLQLQYNTVCKFDSKEPLLPVGHSYSLLTVCRQFEIWRPPKVLSLADSPGWYRITTNSLINAQTATLSKVTIHISAVHHVI